MYKKLLASVLLVCTFTITAQETQVNIKNSVEKSIFSVQSGLVGIWANNELKLSNKLALRSEIGLELASFKFSDSYNQDIKYAAIPVVTLEPKWYYNLERRVRKGRNIAGNSGNSISIKINYMAPNVFMISDIEDFNGADQLNIIPKWTIRRVSGKHFIFEFGFGVGPLIPVGKNAEYVDADDVFADLHLRFGYSF